MKLFIEYTKEEITEHFKTSMLCSLTLINSNVIICNMKEFDDHLILFNSVIVDGYMDENQIYQYYFKPLCVVSKDTYTIIDKNNILHANTVSDSFRNDYTEYMKMKHAKILEDMQKKEIQKEYDTTNVVSLQNRTIH